MLLGLISNRPKTHRVKDRHRSNTKAKARSRSKENKKLSNESAGKQASEILTEDSIANNDNSNSSTSSRSSRRSRRNQLYVSHLQEVEIDLYLVNSPFLFLHIAFLPIVVFRGTAASNFPRVTVRRHPTAGSSPNHCRAMLCRASEIRPTVRAKPSNKAAIDVWAWACYCPRSRTTRSPNPRR